MEKSNNQPFVLFVPSNDANFREMAIVARFLKANKIANPVFFPEKMKSIHSMNNEFVVFDNFSVYNNLLIALVNKINKIVFYKNEYNNQRFMLSFKLGNRFRRAYRFLKKNTPISIVLRGDRHLGDCWEPAFIKAGRLLGIPTIVLTYSYTSHSDSLLYRRRNRKGHNADLHETEKIKFPGQYYFDEKVGSNIFYRPIYALDALNNWGMLPRYPWVMGGGNSNYIIVAGSNTKKRLIRLGCYEKKIIITGLAVHDDLYKNNINKANIKDKIYKKYHLIDNKPLIIVAAVQLYEENHADINTARREIEKLVYICSKVDANILISLHPRMNRSLYEESIRKYNINVADENLFQIIVSADIFSSCYSSTVEWAVLCGIPTVIYDFYQFNYLRYNEYKGIIVVKDEKNYFKELKELISSKKKMRLISEQQIAKARELSPFDGRCLERISNFIINPN